MGILKDLIDQLEEDCGPVNKPLPFANVRESDPPHPLENSATAIFATAPTASVAGVAEIAGATLPKENPESQSLTPLPVVAASDGRVLAWSTDPPHIRVYAWALRHLRFCPVDKSTANSLGIDSGEMDGVRIRTLASDLRMTERELRAGLDRLVAEGDLKVKTERGRRIYWLAPPRYG